jgi:ribonuclease HI
MDYSKNNPGGVGIYIKFPDHVKLENIAESLGVYHNANIERMELEALTQAMIRVQKLFSDHPEILSLINQIIFITDRFGLSDTERLNPFLINQWRSNRWHTYEGKPVKNHELLDRLDKLRKKIQSECQAKVRIEYRPRKKNKEADKLAKTGKKEGLVNYSLAKTSEKIGKRKFNGGEVPYRTFKVGATIHIHIFRKDPVQDKWEVWAELCEGTHQGMKLKIYVDDQIAEQLKRLNEFEVTISRVCRYYIEIENIITPLNKNDNSII